MSTPRGPFPLTRMRRLRATAVARRRRIRVKGKGPLGVLIRFSLQRFEGASSGIDRVRNIAIGVR